MDYPFSKVFINNRLLFLMVGALENCNFEKDKSKKNPFENFSNGFSYYGCFFIEY